jgi:hypothetical protein
MTRIPDALLVRLLADLAATQPKRGEDPFARVERWLQDSDCGTQLVGYLAGEAGLLAMAANRLHASGDADLAEIARELGLASERLRRLAGVEADELYA